jgi:O-antigen/teichoic acid export membrane protein
VCQITDFLTAYGPAVGIAILFGSDEVPGYAVPASVFMTLVSAYWGVGQPYLAEYARCARAGDFARCLTIHTLLVSLACISLFTLGVAAVVFGPRVLEVYTAGRLEATPWFLGVLAVYHVLFSVAQQNAFLLQGVGEVWPRAIIQVTNALTLLAALVTASMYSQLLIFPLLASVSLMIDLAVSRMLVRRRVAHV